MRSGDGKRLKAVLSEIVPRLYRFAYLRVGGDIDATREIVHATLSKAMSALPPLGSDADIYLWMHRVCRQEVDDRTGRPYRHLDQEESSRLVHVLLDQLPERYAIALESNSLDEDSLESIAGLLNIELIAAQSLLEQARTAFRHELECVFGSLVDVAAYALFKRITAPSHNT